MNALIGICVILVGVFGASFVLSKTLNRDWTDDSGVTFAITILMILIMASSTVAGLGLILSVFFQGGAQ